MADAKPPGAAVAECEGFAVRVDGDCVEPCRAIDAPSTTIGTLGRIISTLSATIRPASKIIRTLSKIIRTLSKIIKYRRTRPS